jgi:hypothetical protein
MSRNVLLIVGLLLTATTLSGCFVEPPGYYHDGGWGWHHHDWGDR